MSVTALRIVCGSMPCSSLWRSWSWRRRWVSRDGPPHRVGDLVGVHDHLTVDVAGGAADRLDQRGLRAEEPLLVGVEDGHQRHLGQVEALPEEVDADEHVVLAEAEVAEDLDALDRVDVGVEVADAQPLLEEVVGEVLGHLLGERGDEHPVAALGAVADLLDEVVDLALGRLARSTSGSTRPVGRTICSATWVDTFSS